MEENRPIKDSQPEVSKDKEDNKNKKLIIVIIIVILIALLMVASVCWYMNSQAIQQKSAQEKEINVRTATPQKPISYTTEYEKLKFNYPKDFKLTDTSTPAEGESLPRDLILLVAPNGTEITIGTGLFGIGGSCPGECKILQSDKITVLGKTRYINFYNVEGKVYVGLSDSPDEFMNFIDGKNITQSGQPALMNFNLNLAGAKSVQDYLNNPVFVQYKSLLTSLSY